MDPTHSSPAPSGIAKIHSSPTPANPKLVINKVGDQSKLANKLLNGGALETHNKVSSIQNSDLLKQSGSYAKKTSNQICSAPYPGLQSPQKGGRRRKTRRIRRKTRRIRRKTRRRKTRRRKTRNRKK